MVWGEKKTKDAFAIKNFMSKDRSQAFQMWQGNKCSQLRDNGEFILDFTHILFFFFLPHS